MAKRVRDPEDALRLIIAEAPSLNDATPKALRLICRRFAWDYAEIWRFDPDTATVRLHSHWRPRSRRLKSMEALSPVAMTELGVGLPGRVAASGEPEWLEEIASHPSFIRGWAAAQDGLQTAFACPLLSGDDVAGVAIFFSREIKHRSQKIIDETVTLGRIIGAAIPSERVINKSRRSLRAITDNISDIIAVLSTDGMILFESEAAQKVLGYSPEERLGRNVFDFIHPDDAGLAIEELSASVSQPGTLRRVEVRVKHKDGSWRWLETVGKFETGPSGSIVITSRDISERKQIEAEVNERDVRLELQNRISKGIRSEVSAHEIAELAVIEVARHFPAFRVAYSTIDQGGTLTVIRSIEPEGMPPIEGMICDITASPSYLKALLEGETVSSSDVSGDDRIQPLAAEMGAGATKALCDVPLRHSDALVGLLCFDSPCEHTWTLHEVTTLQEVADYIGIAIREANYRELRRFSEEKLQATAANLKAVLDAFPELHERANTYATESEDPQRHPKNGQIPALSKQELRILALVARGRTNKAIAETVFLSPYTVKDHVRAILKKLGAKNRAEAVLVAAKRGLI